MSLVEFKKQFATGGEWVHLNNAGRAPLPRRTRDLMQNWIDRFYFEGQHCEVEMWQMAQEARTQLAKLAGTSASQVVFFQNTASAISQVALGLKFEPGDEIVVWDQEYPANYYPWQVAARRSGAKLVLAKSDHWQTPVSKILDCVTPKTRAIAISWVQFQTGSITDLKELSSAVKGKNILLLADVIQGLGVRPFGFQESGFDFIVGGIHKWLVSPMSLGYLIGKPESFEKLTPILIGAKTFDSPDTINNLSAPLREGTLKFEPSYLPALIAIALGESLKLINETGIAVIATEANRLATLLRENIKAAGFEAIPGASSIVSFGPKDSDNKNELVEVEKHLKRKNISFGKRGPGIRLSVHAFNTDSDVKIF